MYNGKYIHISKCYIELKALPNITGLYTEQHTSKKRIILYIFLDRLI